MRSVVANGHLGLHGLCIRLGEAKKRCYPGGQCAGCPAFGNQGTAARKYKIGHDAA